MKLCLHGLAAVSVLAVLCPPLWIHLIVRGVAPLARTSLMNFQLSVVGAEHLSLDIVAPHMKNIKSEKER